MEDDEITIGIQSTDLKRFNCNKNDMAYTLKNKIGNNLNYNLTINYRAIEFNKSLKEIKISRINWYIVVLNKMILSNHVDKHLVKKIKTMIKKTIVKEF